ncbi:hypothetical protein L2X98_31375 [Microbacterium elymi]|uniref:Uncharacterized protein n=1 Tax=Microbacterium elymi TaxID=2909587 RepID=A0ABY5NI92_9MICO|nr:hypothetical protein [Microbacterium elymi]UUT34902.1 hypothetical protein L2X98_31375 [Microbacterium elymi]
MASLRRGSGRPLDFSAHIVELAEDESPERPRDEFVHAAGVMRDEARRDARTMRDRPKGERGQSLLPRERDRSVVDLGGTLLGTLPSAHARR